MNCLESKCFPFTFRRLEPVDVAGLQHIRVCDGSPWEKLAKEVDVFRHDSGERSASRGCIVCVTQSCPVCCTIKIQFIFLRI